MASPYASEDGTLAERVVPRLGSIQALRGLAALAVTWFHLTEVLETTWLRNSGAYGWTGVTAFFVISGFVIPYSLYSSHYELKSYSRYLAKRIVRIEPPYLVSIALMIVLSGLATFTPLSPTAPWNVSAARIAAHLFYLVPLTGQTWFNEAYWTLAYEFVFYLIAGLAFPLVRHWHIGGVLAASLPFVAIVIAMSGRQEVAPLLFFLGFACCRYRFGIDRLETTVPSAVVALILIWHFRGNEDVFVALATLGAIAFNPSIKWRPLLALGTISYSLYLTHYPFGVVFIKLCRVLKTPPQFEIFFALAGLITSLAAAYAFWRLVEEPARKASQAITLSPARRTPAAA